MKLIDILVEELPKRGGWPEGANYCHSMYENIYFSVNKPEPAPNGRLNSKDGDLEVNQPLLCNVFASGVGVEEVTREQYESALAASKEPLTGTGVDGWIDWPGGECPPVSTNTAVDVKFKNGYVQSGYPAGEYSWVHAWRSSNIIAYRLHQQQEAELAEVDDEVDLNECIGQGAEPVWSGEGLPPVGCVCEWQDKNTKQWQPVKIVYSSEWVTVIREINKEKGDDLVEIAIENYGDDARLNFRLIRSEADRKRDDICDKIYGAMTNAKRKDNRSDMAEEIYDAIAAGKIPGVKLDD